MTRALALYRGPGRFSLTKYLELAKKRWIDQEIVRPELKPTVPNLRSPRAFLRRDPGDRYHRVNLFHSNGSLSEFICLASAVACAREQGVRMTLVSPMMGLKHLSGLFPWGGLSKEGEGVAMLKAMQYWDAGHGHVIQRLQRILGLPVDPCPRGRLLNPRSIQDNLVVIHSSIGKWGHGCLQDLHEWPVMQLRELIRARTDLQFVQMGPRDAQLGCEHARVDLRGAIDLLGWCGAFIGLPSGLMHVAAAYRKHSVIIYEGIHPHTVKFPAGRKIDGDHTMWLYPQNLHLHAHLPDLDGRRISAQLLSDCLDGVVRQKGQDYPMALDL